LSCRTAALADPTWVDRLTAEDRRGLTPLFWAHVAPYHPPGPSARDEAALLLAGLGPDVTVNLADWADLAEVTR
jgi:hypothetical protein